MVDPNAPQEPTEQEPQAPQEPQVPQLDPEALATQFAQVYGYDPRLAQFEFQELKRKREEFERDRREFEQRQREQPRYEQPPEFTDPQVSYLDRKLDRLIQAQEERDRREQQMVEMEERAERQGQELRDTYAYIMRQNGATPEQIESQADAFFNGTMRRLYPDGIPDAVGIEGAVRNTYDLFRARPNGSAFTPQQPIRSGPRQAVVIPQSTSASPPMEISGRPVRGQNETDEQWVQRLARYFQEKGIVNIGDGVKGIVSE